MTDMSHVPRIRASLRALLVVGLCCVAGAGVASASTGSAARLVTDADSGHTVTVQRGATIRLVLHSTYWRVHGSSRPSVVAGAGAPRYDATRGGVAGSGRGTVTVTYRALARGRATLTASRSACGEALRCTPAQGTYSVTIVVRSR